MSQSKHSATPIVRMMEQTESPPSEPRSTRLADILPASIIVSALGVLFTATIYFIGVQFQAEYFGQFRIDADRFPRGKTQTMLYGINAISTFCQSTFKYFNREWSVLLVTFLLLLAISAFWALLNRAQAKVERWKQQQERVPAGQRGLKFARVVVGLCALPFLSVYTMFGLPLIISALIALPATVGTYAGKKLAQRYQHVFLACSSHLPPTYSFVRIHDGDTIKAQGFLIAASTERVALFEGGVATDYPIKDNEVTYLQGDPRPQGLSSVEHPPGASLSIHCRKAS